MTSEKAVRVRIPTPLRKITGGASEVEASLGADSATIGEVLARLDERYPGLRERLCDGTDQLRRFVNVYVNEEDVRFLSGLATIVKPGDEISIIPAIAGGASPWLR